MQSHLLIALKMHPWNEVVSKQNSCTRIRIILTNLGKH